MIHKGYRHFSLFTTTQNPVKNCDWQFFSFIFTWKLCEPSAHGIRGARSDDRPFKAEHNSQRHQISIFFLFFFLLYTQADWVLPGVVTRRLFAGAIVWLLPRWLTGYVYTHPPDILLWIRVHLSLLSANSRGSLQQVGLGRVITGVSLSHSFVSHSRYRV